MSQQQTKTTSGPATFRHGEWAYRVRKCRCDACKEAHRAKLLREVHRRTARLLADPTVAEHGRASTYRNWGCRCDACRVADSTRRNAMRPPRPRRPYPFREWVDA